MFAVNNCIQKLYKIKWNFNETDKTDLEHILYVEFEQQHDCFIIKNVLYTYVDILLGLEDIDFEVKKINNDLIISILKIQGSNPQN